MNRQSQEETAFWNGAYEGKPWTQNQGRMKSCQNKSSFNNEKWPTKLALNQSIQWIFLTALLNFEERTHKVKTNVSELKRNPLLNFEQSR